MEFSIIETDQAPAPVGPYSQAICSGNFIFVSGQIALDPTSGLLNQDSIEEETELVLKNIQAILLKAGVGMNRVIKTSIFLTNLDTFVAVNQVYARHFAQSPPARETVEVSKLPKGARVEISCIAVTD